MNKTEQALSLVSKICGVTSTDCRSLNKSNLAVKLLELAGVYNAEIYEIPLDWSNQVVITFGHNGEEKNLFAGIGRDNEFHFEFFDYDDSNNDIKKCKVSILNNSGLIAGIKEYIAIYAILNSGH